MEARKHAVLSTFPPARKILIASPLLSALESCPLPIIFCTGSMSPISAQCCLHWNHVPRPPNAVCAGRHRRLRTVLGYLPRKPAGAGLHHLLLQQQRRRRSGRGRGATSRAFALCVVPEGGCLSVDCAMDGRCLLAVSSVRRCIWGHVWSVDFAANGPCLLVLPFHDVVLGDISSFGAGFTNMRPPSHTHARILDC